MPSTLSWWRTTNPSSAMAKPRTSAVLPAHRMESSVGICSTSQGTVPPPILPPVFGSVFIAFDDAVQRLRIARAEQAAVDQGHVPAGQSGNTRGPGDA